MPETCKDRLRLFEPSRMTLLGEGGTHRVYADPLSRSGVVKLFKHPHRADDDDAMGDVHEFAPYLAGRARIVAALIREDGLTRETPVILQPRFEGSLDAATPLRLCYWELQDGAPFDPARRVAELDDDGLIHAFIAREPHGLELASLIVGRNGVREAIVDLLSRVSAYVVRTGRIVDFVGENNVFVHEASGGHRVEALDLVKGDALGQTHHDDRRIAVDAHPGAAPKMSHRDAVRLNVAAFLRMVRVLEILSGVDVSSNWPTTAAGR